MRTWFRVTRCLAVALATASAAAGGPGHAGADTGSVPGRSLAAAADALLVADDSRAALFDDSLLQDTFAALLPSRPRSGAVVQGSMPDVPSARALAAEAAQAASDAAAAPNPGLKEALPRLHEAYGAAAAAWDVAARAQEQPASALPAAAPAGAGESARLADHAQAVSIRQETALVLLHDAAHQRLAARIALVALRNAAQGEPQSPVALRGDNVDYGDAPEAPSPGVDRRFGAVDAYLQPNSATDLRVGWERMQLDAGVAWLDTEAAAGRDVAALLMVPGGRRHVPAGLDLPFDDPGNAWGQSVSALARRFRGRVRAWIVGNEPDVWDRANPYHTWDGTADDYARLLRTSCLAVKAADPDAQVVVGGQTYWWDAASGRPLFFRQVLDALAKDPAAPAHAWYFDAVALHLYSTPADLYIVPAVYRQAMAARGISKPIWIGETNAVPWDVPGYTLPRADYRVTRDEQASYVIQAMSYALAAGVDRIELYTMQDAFMQPEPYGLCSSYGCDRPASRAFLAATTFFAGARAGAPVARDGVVMIPMRSDQYDVTVVWASDAASRRLTVPATAPIATMVDRVGTSWTVQPSGGVYTLTLPGATANTAPGRPDYYPVGGAPVILLQPREPPPSSPR